MTLPDGFHRRTLELVPVPVAVLGPAAELVYVNKAMLELCRATEAEMVGRSAFDFVHPDDQAYIAEVWLGLQPSYHEDPDAQPTWPSLTYRGMRLDGTSSLLVVTAHGALSDPDVGGVVMTFQADEGRAARRELFATIAGGAGRRAALDRVLELIEAETLDLTGLLLHVPDDGELEVIGTDAAVVDIARSHPQAPRAIGQQHRHLPLARLPRHQQRPLGLARPSRC